MADSWDPRTPGVIQLPSGRLLRGRGLRHPFPSGQLPTFGVYLLADPPPAYEWEVRWIRWPEFGLPSDRAAVQPVLTEAWQLATTERVEVACAGGRGRTGTALACLAVLDGVPSAEAVGFVRAHYNPRAVETPWQRRYVTRWRGRTE